MVLLFYAGCETKKGDNEYAFNPTFSPKVAFETARAGHLQNNYKVTFYAVSEKETIAIPFKELAHLDLKAPDLERELIRLSLEKFKK